jgi:hypothetical protein
MVYGIKARVTDEAGNKGESEVVVVIVDNVGAEIVVIVDPYENEIVSGETKLEAIASDQVSGINKVDFYVDGSKVDTDYDPTGNWKITWNSTTVADGVHVVKAKATDNVGHERWSQEVSFIVDNVNPSTPTSLTHIPSGDYVSQDDVTWKWEVSSDAGSGIDYYIIDIDDGSYYTVATSSESDHESYTINLIDGYHEARVKAVDKAGHESGWSGTDDVTIDTVAPSDVDIAAEDIEKQGSYYDTNGEYTIAWSGGTDTNFDHYELFENDVSIYTGTGTSQAFSGKSDGTYVYQLTAYDLAGWSTESEELTVIVDTVAPVIINGTQQSAYPLGWFAPFTVTETGSGVDIISYSTDALLPPICMFNKDTGEGYCYMIGGGNYLIVRVTDKAGWLAEKTIYRVANSDFIPPELLTSSPSGVIDYKSVTLTATTNEPSTCKYGTEDDYSTMTAMDGSGTTSHSADLGTLTDGYKVYHVKCEDMVGNKMEHSKTIVFYIDTTGNFELAIPDYGHYWSLGWNTFFLPEDMLDDICGDGGPYPVENILRSLDGSDPSFDMVWYFDGDDWLFYDPNYPGSSTLTEFNDVKSLPYYIRMITEDRLEITSGNCQLL